MITPLRHTSLLTAAFLASVATADSIDDPYRSSNRNPFVQVYGLPAALSASVNERGGRSAALNVEAANAFSVNSRGGDSVTIDGESYRANLHWRYGLFDGVEVALDVPYLSHQGGGADSFIEDWHDFWGFPEGDRVDYPRDQLNYSVSRDGSTLASLTESDEGLGDVSLSMGYQLSDSGNSQWALRGGVKLATGDADALQGSEGNDVYLGLNFSHRDKLVVHASGGVLRLGDGEVLEALREDWVAYGSTTLSWPVSDVVSLKTQLDFHTAFYDSELAELGDPSVQWLLGGSIRLSEKAFLDISVSEDIAVDTAPDVVFQMALRVGQW